MTHVTQVTRVLASISTSKPTRSPPTKTRLPGAVRASADTFFAIAQEHGYTLAGIELGSNDAACMTCEHNMWLVRADYYRRSGRSGGVPCWPDMVREFWRQQVAWYGMGAGRFSPQLYRKDSLELRVRDELVQQR